ncbi:MAG: UDP-2,4-diacetamido-2,4,6-trideoxy-beta-L-altropyranose hydrolase, partial [Sphingobacteriaceae bacterium]|nr:UDP-2,4-diacetamido-2,4,6-trideoxy-beta-L-altropyranose hydrolase [Cytophagaceae bacterium]
MNPSLLIRADGHRHMGLGHVMRCLALAEMLSGQFRIRFAIHQPGEALRRRIEASGAEVIALKNPADAFELTQHLTDDDLVVLDGYAFDETFQRIVRMQCRRLVFIDDLGATQPVADVVINHAGGLLPEEFDADSRTQLCLGPAYALVHPAFVKARRPPGNGILVNLGGADPPNLSRRVVQTLLDARVARPLTVVLGAANPHRASFENLPGITVKSALGVEEMAEEIAACSLAIASFSTVSYEIATV